MKSPLTLLRKVPGLITTVLLFGLTNPLSGQQDAPPPRYFQLGIGVASHRLQDPAVSPMIYTGGPFSFYLGYEKLKALHRSQLLLSADLGRLSSDNGTELRPMAASYYQIDLEYRYLRQVPGLSAGRFRWWFGGQYRWHNSIRLAPQNDSGFISFFIANSISASARAETTIPLFGRAVELSWTGTLPLLSHVIRPSYLNLYNFLDPEHDWLAERLEDSEWLTLNRFPGLRSQLQLIYPIAGENFLRLGYDWSFYHYDGLRRVNAARHGVTVGVMMRF